MSTSLSDMTPEEALTIVSKRIKQLRGEPRGKRWSLTDIAKAASSVSGRPISITTAFNAEKGELDKLDVLDILDIGNAVKAFSPPPSQAEDDEGAPEGEANKWGGNPKSLHQGIQRRLKERRRALGLSRRELASLAQVSVTFVVMAEDESREPRPSADRLCAVAKALGVTVEWLVTGVGDTESSEARAWAEALLSLSKRDREILKAIVRTMQKGP